MKHSIDETCDFLILYFQSRNCHHWGFVGYKVYRTLITYITAIKDIGNIRMIFEKMVKDGYFEKRKINSKTDYKFLYN
jgi:hypothetical protein